MVNYVYFILTLIVGFAAPLQVSALSEPSSHIKVELLQEEATIQPSRPFWVAIHLGIEKEWHVYWKNPGDVGIPLDVQWDLPAGFTAGKLHWPFPEKFTAADLVGFGYEGDVTLLTQVTPPAQLDPHAELKLQAHVSWLVCSSLTCQPGSATVELPVLLSSEPPALLSRNISFFEDARKKIPKAHTQVKSIQKQEIVQIELPEELADGVGEIRQVDFFPEQQEMIDSSIEATIGTKPGDDNRYYIHLKGKEDVTTGSKHLKGVLVFHRQQGAAESIEAFDIDTPIIDEGGDIAALVRPVSSASSLGDVGSSTASSPTSSFNFEGGVGLAILFAFLGGMILNLMPCVLPVLSFKVMSFVKMAGESRSLTLKHGAMFSFGVILSFWILASAMLVLRAYGQAVGWGFQLQEPLFVVILASLLFIFALSLFGLFEWGMFFASWAGQTQAETAQKSTGYAGSFFNGVLATAVATPCTGPFLGSAVGFAVTLPVFQALLIFTSLGLGMSFPYMLLAAFPSFLRFMPKPGAWMETFKQLMGFLLLGTVLWLLWVFSAQTDSFSLICFLAGLLCFSIGAWIYGRGCSPFVKRTKRVFAFAFVVLFAFIGVEAIIFPRASWSSEEGGSTTQASGGKWDGWEEFSPERVAQLRKEGKPVFIDFTAKWCLICQANHMVLGSDGVKDQLDGIGVVKMKADWTKSDPVITQELSKFGRNSVPLYVFYGGDEKQDAVILPQVLTPDVVVENIMRAMPDDIALR